MHYGLSFAPFNQLSDPRLMAEIAHEAEQVGWDAFFVWDHMLFNGSIREVADPWVMLAAAACNTQVIKLGTLLTPIPRRRPWKLARETVTLDQLSNGRLILGVGLGGEPAWDNQPFQDEVNPRILAEMLDEGLQVLTGLWSGQPFHFEGKHYHLDKVTFLPAPLQSPRIPIWVGGMWPHKGPFRRAAQWDGVCPLGVSSLLTPQDFVDLLAYMRPYRASDAPFDVVAMGATPGNDAAQTKGVLDSYAAAGVNWWVEDASPYRYGWDDRNWTDAVIGKLRERVRQGPTGS